MKYNVALLYREALTHYAVSAKEGGWYEAVLLEYSGCSHDLPPPEVRFACEGRHCYGNVDDQDLMDDLYHAVQMKIANESNALSSDKGSGNPYVSI